MVCSSPDVKGTLRLVGTLAWSHPLLRRMQRDSRRAAAAVTQPGTMVNG